MLSDQDDVWLPNKVEESYQKITSEQLSLVCSDLEVVDKNLNTIHPSMWEFWPDYNIKEKIKKDALGYNDSEMLIAFEYNTPNNCLPIIWVESNDWIPLFKRNDKLYTLQVVGGIKDESIYI